MNKKSLLLIVMSIFLAASVFAASDSYVVKSVTGKVTYEATPGNWKAVSEGQELSAATVINTSLNSTLVVIVDGKEVTIKAMSKGTISSFVGNGVAKGGLKKAGGLKAANIGDEVEGNTKGTATASSRASEAKADVEWDE